MLVCDVVLLKDGEPVSEMLRLRLLVELFDGVGGGSLERVNDRLLSTVRVVVLVCVAVGSRVAL